MGDIIELTSDNKVKLICCGSPVTLDEQPANYGHQFIGRCKTCGNTYGIEDLTEIADEFEESDNGGLTVR